MIHFCRPQAAGEFADEFARLIEFFVARPRREKIARIGEAVGADGPEIRQFERSAEVLADIASRLAVRKFHPKAQSARNHGDFLGT